MSDIIIGLILVVIYFWVIVEFIYQNDKRGDIDFDWQDWVLVFTWPVSVPFFLTWDWVKDKCQ